MSLTGLSTFPVPQRQCCRSGEGEAQTCVVLGQREAYGEVAAVSGWGQHAPWSPANLWVTSQKVTAPAWRIFQLLTKPQRQCVGKVQPLIPN